MKRWDGLTERFMAAYSARGLAKGSVHSMRREWERWGCWLKSRRPRPKLEAISGDQITEYIASRCAFTGKSTQYSVMSRMGMIGGFLVKEGIWRENPLEWMNRPNVDTRHRLPRRIDEAALAKIWESAAQTREVYYRHLWIAILGVLYGLGLRRGEVVALDLADLNRESGELLVHESKTGRERRVHLPATTWSCLEAYLPRRKNLLLETSFQEPPALFVNRRGERLAAHSVSVGISRIMRRAGLKITLHQFRHTCASQLLADGASIVHVQRYLGHRVLETTMRYLHIEDPELRRAMKRHPINHLNNILESRPGGKER